MEIRSRVIKPSRLRERRKKIRRIKLGVGIFLAVLLLVGFVWLSRIQALALSDIVIVGNSVVSSDDLTAIARNDMDGYYWKLIPKDDAFFYPKKEIQNDVLMAFPRIDSVDIALESTHTLRIEVTERQPFALWCKPGQNGNDSCYFFDKKGFIFAEAPDFQGDVFTKYYGLVATSSDPIGSYFLDTSHLADLETFVQAVNNLGLSAVALRATAPSEFELDIDGGGSILFTNTQPFPQTLSNLSTVLASLPLGNKSLHLLNYIDLRFSNKVFYKTSTSTGSSSL